MEAYVTQREFVIVLKEMKKLSSFLTETFGSKFVDFKCSDDILEEPQHANPIHAEKHFNGLTKESTEPISIDPLEDQDDEEERIPIVTSTISLQQSNTAQIVNANKVPNYSSASVSKPVSKIVNSKASAQSNFTIAVVDATSAPSNHGLQRVPRTLNVSKPHPTRRKSIPKSANVGATARAPGEFQLRGRTFYHMPPPSTTTSGITRDTASNDSVPIPIGIETLSDIDIPSPPKRPARPPPLPSFKNRTFGSKSVKQSSRIPSKSSSASSVTKASSSANESEIIQCELCNLFVYSSQFNSHMKNHTLLEGKVAEKRNPLLKKTQICPICSYTCKDFEIYEEHCADHHPDDGFPCPICSRRMSSKSKLKRHLTTHRNIKFECTVCGKAYNRSDNLTAHYKTHKDNEPVTVFYCSTCNMAFSSKFGRDKHVASSHPEKRTPNQAEVVHQGSSEKETDDGSSTNADSIRTPEKIKIDSTNTLGIEFEYEGDDEDL